MIHVAPSILSADFSRLGREIEIVTKGGATLIHIDVMDGHFVPNITIGPSVVQSLKNVSRLPLDVHLMIENPENFISQFVRAGSDRISVHWEACKHIHRVITMIKSAGVKAGIAINPGTPPGHISEILHLVDFVLVMSVNPGFGGQKFIQTSISKIVRLSQVIKARRLNVQIAVDGGVSARNAAELVKAGARVLIAGEAVFKTPDPANAVRKILEAAKITRPLPG